MTELSESFISWVLEQGLPGKLTEHRGEGPVACALEIETGQAKGAINVYDLGADAANIVEFRIVRKGHEDDPAFHLHFEMLDLARAQELFGEMRDVLERLEHPQPTKVLLCCSGGLTTTMFADELTFGVPTFVENDANAACVGCYVSQGDYENVTLLVQHAGHVVGGAGTIVGGRLVKGYKGYAGEIKAIQQLYSLPEDVESRAWNPEAMTQVAMAHIVAASSLVAPEACFVAMDMVPDMEALKVEVEKHMPAAFAPTLIHVANERERTFLGMFALALTGLQAR